MDATTKTYLIDYVVNQKLTPESKLGIQQFCKVQQPLSIILFRGHVGNIDTINPISIWYSATLDKNIAETEFADKYCCVFKIHLINVPCIDINYYIGDEIGDKQEEKEFIFLGGGTFYKNNNLTEPGFLNLGRGNFECWYSIVEEETKEEPNETKINRMLEQISEEEYEFINNPTDIIGIDFDLTEEERILIYNEIKKRMHGGKINPKKTNKNRRKKTNRRKKPNKNIRKKTNKNKRN